MKIKKLTAILLCSSILLLTACGTNSSEKPSTPTDAEKEPYVQQYFENKAENVLKTETVYVNLDSNGNVQNVNVSEWLHTNEAEVYVDDESDLENIINIKSEVEPLKTESGIRWHMPDTDLYYSGTSKKSPPVDISLKYYLDGKEISPEKLAGKDGRVDIKIQMKNNTYKDVKIDGKKHRVYLPVIALGGMILPEGVFSGVDIKNGQSIGDGSKEIVVFTGLPGFSESLDVSNKELGEIGGLIISDEVTISAQAKNFRLSNMYFAVLPIASLNLDFAIPETMDDLKNMLAALKSFQNALNTVDPERMIYSFLSDKNSVKELVGVMDDALKIYRNNKNLVALIGKYATKENADSIGKLLESLNDPEVKEALKLLSDPRVQKLMTKLPGIFENFEDLEPVMKEIQTDLQKPEIKAELDKLPETIEALSDITAVISKNSDAIDAVLQIIGDDGTKVVEELLKSIDIEDFKGIKDKYGELAENGDLLLALSEEWLHFGTEYGLFGGSASNAKTSLAFIFNTPSIEKHVQPSAPAEQESLPWYKKIFK